MSHVFTEKRITMACPSGHRVRGGVELIGRTVKCPKCQSQFEFRDPNVRVDQPVESRKVTDTSVMRILGEMGSEADLMPSDHEVALRPCTRCGVAIPESLTVCSHCNCYVGVMPSFMKQMTGNTPQRT
jgi:hypothetical protein